MGQLIRLAISAFVLAAALSAEAFAQQGARTDPPDPTSAEPVAETEIEWLTLRLGLRAEVELEIVDVEGEGGFSNRSPNLLKPEITSTYFNFDKLVLTPIITLNDYAYFEAELRANDKRARLDKAFFRTKWIEVTSFFELQFELGKHKPFVRRKRHTEAYPLLGTAFWKGREYHATVDSRFTLGPVDFGLGLSAGIKRRLGTDDAAEDDSFKMLVYDDAKVTIGNEGTYGAKLHVGAFGVKGLAYGYIGNLIDKGDLDTLDQTFNDYRDLGDSQDRTHWWFGGRIGYYDYGARAVAERVESQDGLLRRTAWYFELTYNVLHFLPNRWVTRLEPVFRIGELLVRRVEPTPRETQSWDRQMILVGGVIGITDWVQLKLEYYFLDEVTGVQEEEPLNDNQFVVQLRLEYEQMFAQTQEAP